MFKIRCSAIGKIMTNSRSKSEVLSKTTQSYCKQWLKEQLYNKRYEFTSKFTDKGNECEDESIEFAAEMLGLGMLFKNEEHFTSDHMTGTPDVITKDFILDVKNSWDCFSFPLFETEVPNKDYYWQAQGYMYLTDRKQFKLVYVLSDTPEELIYKECRSYCYRNNIDEVSEELFDEFYQKMTYKDTADEFKIKVFEIERNDEDIEKIKARVEECRDYIQKLKI